MSGLAGGRERCVFGMYPRDVLPVSREDVACDLQAVLRPASRFATGHDLSDLMARPTRRTPEREARLLQALKAGNTRAAAAAYAGISDRTLRYWAEQSAVFADALSRAEDEAEVALVANIRIAGQTDWRAHAWLLERRKPESWGRRERVDLNVRNVAAQIAASQGLDVDALLAEAEQIVKGIRG